MDKETMSKLARGGVTTYEPSPGMIAFHDKSGKCFATMRMIAPHLRAAPSKVEPLPKPAPTKAAKPAELKAGTRVSFLATPPWLRDVEREMNRNAG